MVDALEPGLKAVVNDADPAKASREGAEATAKMVRARVGRPPIYQLINYKETKIQAQRLWLN